jgi:PAS domain S-box-containing protein
MSVAGDRQSAGLLSALAEAPDSAAASAFLAAQLAELSGAERVHMFRLDGNQESLISVAGFDQGRPSSAAPIPLSDFGNPAVISALALSPVVSTKPHKGFAGFEQWTSLPMTQLRNRLSPPVLSRQHASELLAPHGLSPIQRTERVGMAPGGLIILDRALPPDMLEDLADLVLLASPMIVRLASLEDAWANVDRLGQQSERFRVMVNSLPDPVVITTAANDIIVQNHRAERLLQVREEDSPGRRRAIELNNLLFTSFLAKAVMTGSQQAGPRELNLVDPDEGNDLLFEVIAHPLGERVGPEDAVLSVLRDVTDLRRAANELERQIQRVRQAEQKSSSERDRLNLILENVADPILVTDERSNIILMNDQAELLFEDSGAQARSRRELQAIRGNDTKFTSFISEFALLDADARRERMVLLNPRSGSDLPVEVVSGKVRNERREAIAIVSVLHDLTKQVENERLYEALKQLNADLENRIREATADLAEQNARLQWQSQEVERANKLKSEFLASMSHELRTPINALIGYTALLLDGVLGEITDKQRDALARGRAAAEHLLALINDILDLAKIEAGKMPLHVAQVTIRDIVLEVGQQIEPMVRKKQLQFTTDVSPEVPPIMTDRTKVKQVLLNLLSNAVKFTTKGGVTLRARPAEAGVQIDVIDTGIGIRAEDLQAIWEDFRQVDQSRTREFGGTGLGLSITRKLLDRLGGSVMVHSNYGEGSVFSVTLPLSVKVTQGDTRTPELV